MRPGGFLKLGELQNDHRPIDHAARAKRDYVGHELESGRFQRPYHLSRCTVVRLEVSEFLT